MKPMYCKHCLFGVYPGKPLITTLYSTITDRGEDITYRYLLQRLEKKWWQQTWMKQHRLTFTRPYSNPVESLNDWADQVLTLANRAYGRFTVLIRPQ